MEFQEIASLGLGIAGLCFGLYERQQREGHKGDRLLYVTIIADKRNRII